MYIEKYREQCRKQRAESRKQRAESSERCPPGKKPSCRWWGSTDLYLALNDRERHHSSEAGLAARWQVAPSRRWAAGQRKR